MLATRFRREGPPWVLGEQFCASEHRLLNTFTPTSDIDRPPHRVRARLRRGASD